MVVCLYAVAVAARWCDVCLWCYVQGKCPTCNKYLTIDLTNNAAAAVTAAAGPGDGAGSSKAAAAAGGGGGGGGGRTKANSILSRIDR